jgi:hypothetical protein
MILDFSLHLSIVVVRSVDESYVDRLAIVHCSNVLVEVVVRCCDISFANHRNEPSTSNGSMTLSNGVCRLSTCLLCSSMSCRKRVSSVCLSRVTACKRFLYESS